MEQTWMKAIFFALILMAVVLEVLADFLFKKWAVENKNVLLAIGLAIYFVGTVFWAISLKYEFLSKAISVFTVLNLVMVVAVGAVVFKEEITLLNKAGVLLGIISVILIES